MEKELKTPMLTLVLSLSFPTPVILIGSGLKSIGSNSLRNDVYSS